MFITVTVTLTLKTEGRTVISYNIGFVVSQLQSDGHSIAYQRSLRSQ